MMNTGSKGDLSRKGFTSKLSLLTGTVCSSSSL